MFSAYTVKLKMFWIWTIWYTDNSNPAALFTYVKTRK